MSKQSFLTPKTYTLADGAELTLAITGNMFVVTASTAPVGVKWSIAGEAEESEFSQFEAGMGYALQSGEKYGTIKLKNTSGAPNTVTIYFGTGMVSDFRKRMSLDATTITALASAINASVELKVKIVTVPANGAPVVFSGCKSFEAIAAGGGGDWVTLTSPSGLNYNLPSGLGKRFTCETDNNHLEDITVNPSVTCAAEVTAIYL